MGGFLVVGAAAADDEDDEDDDHDAAPLLLLLPMMMMMMMMMMLFVKQLGLMNDAGGAYGAKLGTTVGGPSAHFAVQAGSSASKLGFCED